MCLWKSEFPPSEPSADQHTLINQGQTSATPLITLHLKQLLHIYHGFKGALRDLMICCIPHVFHHSVSKEEDSISLRSFTNTKAQNYIQVEALEKNPLFNRDSFPRQVLCPKMLLENIVCLHEKQQL